MDRMFFEEQGDISLFGICSVLPEVRSVAFTNLSEEILEAKALNYIESVKNFVATGSLKLHQVEFRSEPQNKGRLNTDIHDLVVEQAEVLLEMGWSMTYDYYDKRYHRIRAQRMEYHDAKDVNMKSD